MSSSATPPASRTIACSIPRIWNRPWRVFCRARRREASEPCARLILSAQSCEVLGQGDRPNQLLLRAALRGGAKPVAQRLVAEEPDQGGRNFSVVLAVAEQAGLVIDHGVRRASGPSRKRGFAAPGGFDIGQAIAFDGIALAAGRHGEEVRAGQ